VIFEVIEQERVHDVAKLRDIFTVYRRHGFRNALDDFGAGFAGLNLLAELPPDILKLDMDLTRDIQDSAVRRAIIAGMVGICRELNIALIAEGIENDAELAALRAAGIRYAQGFHLGRPTIGSLIKARGVAPGTHHGRSP
jgi:EAL domain-containing protein (putative c-di-GMP-specific phosphodiesterase class I)